MMLRARSRSACSGEISATIAISPAWFMSRASSAARRIFSLRSADEKPKSLHKPRRNASPSKMAHGCPLASNAFSSERASVVFPAPDNPVNQMVM